LFVAFPLLVFGSAAMAQAKPAAMAKGKIDTKWHCPKPVAEQKFDVGDVPGHGYGISQGACDATSSDDGFTEKTGAWTEFEETWKGSISSHGRNDVTMDNGNTVYFTYAGSGLTDTMKSTSNKWKILGGSGKHQGTKGAGTCTGKLNADGSRAPARIRWASKAGG